MGAWAVAAALAIAAPPESERLAYLERSLAESELEGTHVVAMNVKRLGRDNVNPENYRSRMAEWDDRVASAGAAGWRTLMDAEKLPDYLASLR